MRGSRRKTAVRCRPSTTGRADHAAIDERLIDIREAWKIYHVGEIQIPAVRGVSLEISAGEYVAVTGPSGSGKSTFMHLLGCLDRMSSGVYRFEGRAVQELSKRELARLRNQRIGFVFQSFNLLSRTTIVDNVALPLIYQGVHKAERRRRATEMLDRVGLGDRLRHYTNQLSGGQQQRVAIARAAVTRPAMVLADRPTGNLEKTSHKSCGCSSSWIRGRSPIVLVRGVYRGTARTWGSDG